MRACSAAVSLNSRIIRFFVGSELLGTLTSLFDGIQVTFQAEEDEFFSFVSATGLTLSSKTTTRSRPPWGANQSEPFGTDVVDTRTCSFSKMAFCGMMLLSGAPEMTAPRL